MGHQKWKTKQTDSVEPRRKQSGHHSVDLTISCFLVFGEASSREEHRSKNVQEAGVCG